MPAPPPVSLWLYEVSRGTRVKDQKTSLTIPYSRTLMSCLRLLDFLKKKVLKDYSDGLEFYAFFGLFPSTRFSNSPIDLLSFFSGLPPYPVSVRVNEELQMFTAMVLSTEAQTSLGWRKSEALEMPALQNADETQSEEVHIRKTRAARLSGVSTWAVVFSLTAALMAALLIRQFLRPSHFGDKEEADFISMESLGEREVFFHSGSRGSGVQQEALIEKLDTDRQADELLEEAEEEEEKE
ncbi:hypothetical protein Efla_000470 [Eimeria flavescens]